MAASDYVTPTSNLLPGTTARADDVNEKFDAVNSGFEMLPIPRADAKKGFDEPIHLPAPTEDSHAATKSFIDGLLQPVNDAITALQDALATIGGYATQDYVDTAISEVTASIQPVLDALPSLTQLSAFAKIKVISDAAYTITAEDNGYILWFDNAAGATVTFPDSGTLPFENNLQGVIIQAGDAPLVFEAELGSGVATSGDLLSTAAKYAPVSYFRVSASLWWVGGERA